MLKQIMDNFKHIQNIEKDIKKEIEQLRKTKRMIRIEKHNTKKHTLENEIIKLKQEYIDKLKELWDKEMIEEVDGKQYKLMLNNAKNYGWKDFEFLDIKEIKE